MMMDNAKNDRSDSGAREVTGVIERVVSEVPLPATIPVEHPEQAVEELTLAAARKAAMISGSLALPPGPLGMLTVLPDLYVIWRIQRQMVADIFALHGRTAELTRTSMLYCMFRHAASQVLRDVAVRAGERFVVRQMSSAAFRSAMGSIGSALTRRVAGTSASRWLPVAGAAAVAAYAYWDTLQVAKTARKLLARTAAPVVVD